MKNPLAHTGAAYRPAMQDWTARVIGDGTAPLRTDGKLSSADLHLLSGKGLAHVTHFLQAAPDGVEGSERSMVATRDRAITNGMADSGGYQASTGVLKLTERRQHEMFRFSETMNSAAILDGPTSSITNPKSKLRSLADCMRFTELNALYAIQHRVPGKTKLLNVSQGRSRKESEEWLEAVSKFSDPKIYGERALDGWAIAGAARLHFSIQLRNLIVLRDNGLLRNGAPIHVLGTGHPEVACALSAVQSGLQKTIGEDIEVSFDSATPFIMAGKYKKALGVPTLNRKGLQMTIAQMPHGDMYVGSGHPWPVSSPFANRLDLGDLNVRKGDPKSAWDTLSHVLVAVHNVWVMCRAIALVNHQLSLPSPNRNLWLPPRIVELAEIIQEILVRENSHTMIDEHQVLLDMLRHKSRNTKLLEDYGDADR